MAETVDKNNEISDTDPDFTSTQHVARALLSDVGDLSSL
jgi:hypothetical protein